MLGQPETQALITRLMMADHLHTWISVLMTPYTKGSEGQHVVSLGFVLESMTNHGPGVHDLSWSACATTQLEQVKKGQAISTVNAALSNRKDTEGQGLCDVDLAGCP